MKTRLGRYIVYANAVSVFVCPEESGGATRLEWTKDGYITMEIGVKDLIWPEVLNVALHEILELCFVLGGRSYSPFSGLKDMDNGRFLFVADHTKFSEIVHNAADALAHMEPDLFRMYRKLGGK